MLVSAPVLGQGATTAEQHFKAGLEQVEGDKWAAAREEFGAAYAADPQPRYLAALIQAEIATGQDRDAAQHLTTILRRTDLDPKTRAEAEKKLAELAAKLGKTRIQVNIEGAEIRVDGVVVGLSPLQEDIFVDPGQRTFEAKKEGYAPARIVEDVKAGSEPKVGLELRKVETGPTVPGGSAGPNKTMVYAGIGVTGGLVLVGVGLGVVANNLLYSAASDKEYGIGCSGRVDCENQYNDLHDTRITLNYVALGAFIGAGVAGVGTLIYALTAKKSDDVAKPHASVMVGPGGGGLMLTGKF
ncbi:PEGA domain-containing protein [Polyangium fumosum]|uniref:PEGA domain-containing protein n=1 Tax=Polyangium fumosum TaxID=889272 RepID=UPI0014780C37|nr:PEGA domain-containing protein [Polyangium fumosum]